MKSLPLSFALKGFSKVKTEKPQTEPTLMTAEDIVSAIRKKNKSKTDALDLDPEAQIYESAEVPETVALERRRKRLERLFAEDE